jgi:hypothetical protein
MAVGKGGGWNWLPPQRRQINKDGEGATMCFEIDKFISLLLLSLLLAGCAAITPPPLANNDPANPMAPEAPLPQAPNALRSYQSGSSAAGASPQQQDHHGEPGAMENMPGMGGDGNDPQ